MFLRLAFIAILSHTLYVHVNAEERFDNVGNFQNDTNGSIQPEFCSKGRTCCEDDIHTSSMINMKIFLRPKALEDRLGSWFKNVEYCRNHCSEMVSVQSEEENSFLKNWLRSGGINEEGAWLGGQVVNANSNVQWLYGDPSQYSNWRSGQPAEGGVTCVHMGYLNTLHWWNYYCDHTTEVAIVCQRRWRLI